LANAEQQFRNKLLTRKLNALEQCYISGRLGLDETKNILQGIGLDQRKWQQYLDLWDALKLCSTHLPTVSELVKSYKDNLIDEDELATALGRLNFSSDAIATIVANAEFDVEEADYKAAIKQQKEYEQATEKLARALESQIKRQQRLKKADDTIRLNLDKAYLRAGLIEELATLRGQEAVQKGLAKGSEDKALITQEFDTELGQAKASEVEDVATEQANVDESDL
jgi:hypothetical protein